MVIIPSVRRGTPCFSLRLLCVSSASFVVFWSRHRLAMCCHGIFHFTAAQHKHPGNGGGKPHKLTRLTPLKIRKSPDRKSCKQAKSVRYLIFCFMFLNPALARMVYPAFLHENAHTLSFSLFFTPLHLCRW